MRLGVSRLGNYRKLGNGKKMGTTLTLQAMLGHHIEGL